MEKLFDLKAHFGDLKAGYFLERLNRFVGLCRLKDGKKITCHIADTGRLKEILTEGREILLALNPKGYKTDAKLVAAKMEEGFILLNTSIHSKIAENIIKSGALGFVPLKLEKEVAFGKSRIDFLLDGDHFVEVKGCNLKVGDKGLFPDAPTVRGRKHLLELINAVEKGFKATILVMVMRDVSYFSPNFDTDPDFSKTFLKALEVGVNFKAVKVRIKHNYNLVLSHEVKLQI
ncbi:DNA/RNA nuclease SfsA [Desulfurobacterium atlanticum]|uniref:Sugar fermentation stimulation protein homolog n=1 Tax=Desulfurobacterium atlanticum TaxID=240169 RepID=A0A238Z4T4_9BACT|nr:DNA/RNA nuclease SfsA [Desulfurobacterium atlanticum]SNR77853.1 sugar fermentation stimulation protein A [Desulfurobacterium atlanticum]